MKLNEAVSRRLTELLAEKIRAVANPEKLIIVPHEPFSGAHVGPGMLALFFYGSER